MIYAPNARLKNALTLCLFCLSVEWPLLQAQQNIVPNPGFERYAAAPLGWQVLAREPRHFGAIAGLGMIMRDLGEDKYALDMFRRALAIHPRLPRLPELVKDLAEKVDGRDI